MKPLFVFIFVLLIFLFVQSQEYGIEWEKVYGGSGIEQSFDIAIDNSNYIYITGESGGNYYTIKYDSLGNIVWTKIYNIGVDGRAYGIAIDNNNYIYVTGGLGGNYCTIKYDSLSNLIWVETYDNGGTELAYDIIVDENYNVYVVGYTYAASPAYADWLILKYDSLGNIVWADTLDSGGSDMARGITIDNNNNIYVTGNFNKDYLTVKYDTSGNIIWSKTYDNSIEEVANAIAVDNNYNVYITGYSRNSSNKDYFTIKYDSLGNLLWIDSIDNGEDDIARDITLDEDVNVYITGYSQVDGVAYCFTVKYDSLGNELWRNMINDGNDANAEGIVVDNNDNIYITGYTATNNLDYYTVKYAKYRDAGLLYIFSRDTVSVDSNYIPEVYVKNNSYKDTLSFDIAAYIDSLQIHVYSDLKSIYNLLPGDSMTLSFDTWNATSTPYDYNLRFSIFIDDMNADNDTISKILYIRDFTFPIIDSAIAYDGTNPVGGIDNDDYVILYFSESTNKPIIDATNIDSVLSLSGGHTWLDGAGGIGSCDWDADGRQLQINLTTLTSLPTITVGDTIIPDSATITDINDNPCSSKTVLIGAFETSGIIDEVNKNSMFLNVSNINSSVISLSYNIVKSDNYEINIYTIDGKIIKNIKGNKSGYHRVKITSMPAGVYFIRLKQDNKIINKKIIFIKK